MRACGRLSADELAALPTLARGAALRFLLTRTYDWLNTDGERAGASARTRTNICASSDSISKVKSYRDYGLGEH